MNYELKSLLRPYTPLVLRAAYSFWRRHYENFLYKFFRIHVDKKSKIYNILTENWQDYRIDLYPKDRRMSILEQKNVIGMSSENIRFLINEAVRKFAKEGLYLEVGTFYGNSLLSAALFNPSTRCIGIDNFSQHNPYNENEGIVRNNLGKFSHSSNVEFYNQDYKEGIKRLFSHEPSCKVNVYYYDGFHHYRDQLQGLEIILPCLAQECVILVDDINLEDVEEANKAFLRKNPDFKSVFKVRTEKNGSKDWWNGFELITRGI